MTQAKPLEQAVFESKMGRYEIVKLALDWIEVKKHEDDYRRLSQAELITKVLNEVMDGTATPEKIEELQKKMKAKEAKPENEAGAESGKTADSAKAKNKAE